MFETSFTAFAIASALALAGASAQGAGYTVLVADESAPHAEFVRQLRDAGGRFELERLAGSVPAEEDRVNIGVRTRSARPSAGAAADATVTVAVGATAARAAIERPSQEPLLLAMLTRLDYEGMKSHPALRRGDRRVGVLLRDPAMADQLALVDAVMPNKRRLGVVATAESEPLLRELQRAAAGWDLQIEYAPDAKSLANALRSVLPRSDALMVLPDLIGDNQAAALAVLRAGAGAGVPVFGASEGLVRSGGLAAAVSTPAQLAQQARQLAQKLANGSGVGANGASGVLVEAATPATVRVNTTVARGLGLRLPDERELTERVTAVR
ncbi:MAG: ABC transporter substrate-binding protein [Comamonadaceae bacterium]|nr:MAG: ABC transporter substrate-binding protein [Comamonadaceae bacterium]